MRFKLLGLLFLSACGGGGTDPVTPPPPPPPPPGPAPVFTVVVNRDTATLVPRQTLQLVAVARDQGGNALSGRSIAWSSATGTVASVSADGLVTAIAAGTSSVAATSEGKTGAATITVKDGAVVSAAGGLAATADSVARVTFPAGALAADQAITISPVANPLPDPRLLAGTAFDFGPSGTFPQPVTIRISYAGTTVPVTTDPARLRLHRLTGGAWVEVAGSTVDVTAKTVTGQTSSFSTYAIIELAPLPVATVSFARDTATLVPTQTLPLVVVFKEQGGAVLTGRTVAWSSSAPSIATVSGTGTVTAVSAGTATITASSEGKSGAAVISVKDGAQMGVSGGVVSTANGVAKVTLPAGALVSSQTITIEPVLNPVASPQLVPGTAFEFGPSGSFAQPLTMTISYAGSTVPVATDPSSLRINRLTNGAWVPLPGSTVDVNTKTVTAQTSSFSTYAILGTAPAQQVILTCNVGTGCACSLPPGTDPLCGFLANPGYWTVPPDVYTVLFELWGGAGGGFAGIGMGGKGGKTTATITVFPGEVILVAVGSPGGFISTPGGGGHGGFGRSVLTGNVNGFQPGSGGFCTFVPPNNDYAQPCGGFNGNGGAGGGATTVQRGVFGPKIIVAGGGGGDGASRTVPMGSNPVAGWALVPGVAGGLGGGLVGGDGAPGNGSQTQSAPGGGGGGSQLSGGHGGAASDASPGFAGEDGTAQFGGGAGGTSSETGGGGGGGGWFGGGGGGPTRHQGCCDITGFVDRSTGGGGGGGSSFGPPGSVFFQGVNVGGGKAIVTYTPSPGLVPTVVALTSSRPNPSHPNQPITFTATVSPKPPATGVITGSVQFEINGVVVGGGPIPLVNGQANTGPLNLPLGNQAVRVVYLGTSTQAPSAANLLQTILP